MQSGVAVGAGVFVGAGVLVAGTLVGGAGGEVAVTRGGAVVGVAVFTAGRGGGSVGVGDASGGKAAG